MSTETPIRVGIDGRVLMHYEMRGFARYTVELFRAMKEIAGSNVQLISFSPGPIAPEFLGALDITPVMFQARREILWEQVELPKQLQRARIDVFHTTANRGLPYRRMCKYVLTCHDIIDRLPEYCGQEHWRGRWRNFARTTKSGFCRIRNLRIQFQRQRMCGADAARGIN